MKRFCVLYSGAIPCSMCGECVGPRDYLTEAEYQMEIFNGNIDEDTEDWIQ